LLSTGFLSGLLSLNYFFGVGEFLKEERGYGLLNALAGLVIFATGIANIFLVK
jgi:hypothetical protein